MRLKLAFAGGIAAGLYTALFLKSVIVLLAMYHDTSRAALVLHEWPITAAMIATLAPFGFILALTVRHALVRCLLCVLVVAAAVALLIGLNALLVPGPLTASAIGLDLFSAAVVVVAAPFVVLAVGWVTAAERHTQPVR